MSKSRSMAASGKHNKALPVLYDRWLLVSTFGLVAFGLLMVASASIVISYRMYSMPFHFLFHQLTYLSVGLILGIFIVRTDVNYWYKLSSALLVLGIALLVLVLIPGIGRQINGSMRWLGVGPIGIQVSELVKLLVIIYIAGYLVRRGDEVRTRVTGFIKPLCVLIVIVALLLKQPDFGAGTVILATALGMMYLAGVRLWQFGVLLGVVVVGLAGIAISSPYRLMRITTFLNPWAHAFQSGYQLTQSLIAFGRGGWFGVGLGGSVQKLFYLPEAHTDFIFAVLAEELGLVGMLAVILLFVVLVTRALMIGRRAQRLGEFFAAYVAYGIALWVSLQVLINIGVNSGVLPTKGLTLPLISYGGSSLTITCLTLALLLRIDHESRLLEYGFSKRRKKKKKVS